MQHSRSRKLKTFVATLAIAAFAAPVSQAGLQVDARHQALLDRAPQLQVDAHHQILLRHRYSGQLGYVSIAPEAPKESSGLGDGWAGIAALGGVILIGASGALVGHRKLANA